MPTKRNYLVKVMDAKIVDVKRALEAKGIKIESIYEMYKEAKEPEKVVSPPAGESPDKPAAGAPKTPEAPKPSEPSSSSPSSSSMPRS